MTRKSCVNGLEEFLGTTEPLQRTTSPFDRLGTVSGVREKV